MKKIIYCLFYWLTIITVFLSTVKEANTQLLFQLGNKGDTYGRAIAIDKDSNFIVAGTFQGTLNFNPKGTNELTSNVGSIDIFIAKYSQNGNYIWAKNIGTTGIDVPTAVKVDNSGNVFISGYFGSENLPGRFIDLDPGPKTANFYGEGGIDCFIVKLNPAGDYQWGFVLTNKDNFGSEIIWDFAVNSSGQLFLSGIFSGTVDFNPLGTRKRITCPTDGHGYFVAKYSRTGENTWVSVIGANIEKPFEDGFSSIDIDGSGNCIIAGNFRDTAKYVPDIDTHIPSVSAGNSDMFIAKYNSLGKITFRGGFGGKEQDRIFPGCAKIGTDGNLYIAGNFLGKADFYPGIGIYQIENNNNSKQIFLASYTLAGTLRWVYTMNSDDEDEDVPLAMDFDYDGNICLGGYFTGSTNFNLKGEKILTSKGTSGAADAFLAKYDNMGNLIWANQFGSHISGKDKYNRQQFTTIHGMKIDKEDNALVTGKFYGSVDFDPSAEESTLKANTIFDMFLAKYDYDGELWFDGGTRPKLRLISPNGGEVWNVDSTRTISWTSKNIDLIRVDYSIDDGDNWMMIADSVSASSSSYSWIVEHTPSENCRVKLTNLLDYNVFDISNGKFEITAKVKPSRVIFSWGNLGPVSGKSLTVDSKNNLIVTGDFQGTINCDQGVGLVNLTAKGNQDMVIAKYNEFGDLIWAKNIGSVGLTCEPNKIAIDKSDNIYVAGFFGKAGETHALLDFNPDSNIDTIATKGGFDAFIAKYDKDGKFIWANAFGNSLGTTKEVINDMYVEANGTIYVTGVFSGTVDFDPSKTVKNLINKDAQPELFIAKYSSEGKYVWAINIANKMTNPEIEGRASIIADGSGGCFVSGNFRDSVNFHPLSSSGIWMKSKAENDIFFARYKVNGYLDWANQIEGDGNDLTHSNCLAFGQDGRLYITGIFDGKADFYPGLPKIEKTSTAGNADIFLASYSVGGIYNWVKTFPSNNGFDFPKAITLDTAGNILLTGYISHDINFGDNENSMTFTSLGKNGATDVFLAKFDASGNPIWVNHFGADTTGMANNSQPNDLIIDKSNNYIITGDFYGENVDFDFSETDFYLSSQGRNDAFVAKYFQDGNLWIQAPDTSLLYLIKPNGGEKLNVNTIYNITWQSKYIDFVTIKYSTDGGTNWNTINETVQANTGIYPWVVPNTPSTNCKILIYNPDNTRKSDISSGKFTITDKYLDLISPNGNEQLVAGKLQEIKWSSNNVDKINIFFSSDAGSNWDPLALYYSASLSSMTWTGREINSNQCLMKIIDLSDSEVFDISGNYFTMRKSILNDVRVFSPNGGEEWLIDNQYNIAWSSNAVDSVKIELSTDAGKSWTILAQKYPAVAFFYDWVIDVHDFVSDSCLIKISDAKDLAVYDISDSLFMIKKSSNIKNKINDEFEIVGLYPQPSDNYLVLKLNVKNNPKLKIEIFNSMMSCVDKFNLEKIQTGGNDIKINTSNLPSGNYIIKIIAENGISYVSFIVLK